MFLDDVPQMPADGGTAADDSGAAMPDTDAADTGEEKTGEGGGAAM